MKKGSKNMEEHIKNSLRNIQEQGEGHPGLRVTQSTQKKEDEINSEYYDEVEKKMNDYEPDSEEDEDEDFTLDKPRKFEPDEDEQEYIEDMERSKGLQHFEYDNEPPESFKKRAQSAIEGDDSRLGNKIYTGDENGNTEPTWGASDENFGKDLVDQANRRKKRTDKAKPNTTSFGDDIEVSDKDKTNRSNAFGESKKSNKKAIKENKKSNKMKRLKFNKKFNGMDNALKLIPEHHKVNGNKFELTDGNEIYRVRWDVNEGVEKDGRPIVLESKNNEVLTEESKEMKRLMNFDPKDSFGNLKGKQRLQEGDEFNKIWNKSKKIMTEAKEVESGEKIQRLDEVEDKLKKKHIPKLAKKPLHEVASSMANKRLKQYNTKFNDINEAFDLKNNIQEGMTYDKLNYIIEEGVKEAARKSLIKEDVKADEASKLNEQNGDEPEGNPVAPGTSFKDDEQEMEEQHGGHDPSEAAGAGLERVVKGTAKFLKNTIGDKEKIMKILNAIDKKLGEIGSGAGAATGTGTSGVKRESVEISEDTLNEIDEAYGGHDPSEGAGAGVEVVINALKKLGDKETMKAAVDRLKEFFEGAAEGAGGATGTGTGGVKRESEAPAE